MKVALRSLTLLSIVICVSMGYKIGSGIYDITGPAAQIGFMGYAMTNQTGAGIHFRLHARAFIFSDGHKRVALVSTDSCMIYTSVKREVVKALGEKFGDLYTQDNVMLSGKHTHSGPGGYSEYPIYSITTEGFHHRNWKVIIDGIVEAISLAHNSMVDGEAYLNVGTLLHSNINRSPSAYANNPSSERAMYEHNVDKNITVLKLVSSLGDGVELGHVNWFAVHGTSMNNWNQLISGDNKGYASYAFERAKNGNGTLPGSGPFVAMFCQSNEGDVSPNTLGAFCWNGRPCEEAHSTCGGTSEGCRGRGPGETDFQSTKIIGEQQFRKAMELHQSAKHLLRGPVGYVHTFVDMSRVVVEPQFSGRKANVSTCPGALGDGFAAGTTDGPGDFNFIQGTNSTSKNPYWNFLGHWLSEPSDAQKRCQAPKPILLNTGGISFPAPWTPSILPLQMFRIGQLFIVGVPGEFTTMSGRRLRHTVRQSLLEQGASPDATVVIAGLSNAYSQYIATPEEYDVQRYEGASTLFGRWTLDAYRQHYHALAKDLVRGISPAPGPSPPDLSGDTFTFLPDWNEDAHPIGGHFGMVHQQPKEAYSPTQIVSVSFWGANPRNDFMTNSTFLSVEREVGNGQWKVEYTDAHWETKFLWERVDLLLSKITVLWDIPSWTNPGRYRIAIQGYSKDIFGALKPYSGVTRSFNVVSK